MSPTESVWYFNEALRLGLQEPCDALELAMMAAPTVGAAL